jgi:serine/threonine protein kinase/tetratricopeptide (TPR) repeat protein
MASDPIDLSAREQRLDEVVAAYLKAVDTGHEPDPWHVLEHHRDLLPELVEFFLEQNKLNRITEPLRPAPPVQQTATLVGEDTPLPSPESASAVLEPEIRVLGDYELLEKIAQGGMGVVYKARHRVLNRMVALKMIRADALESPADEQRFRKEAEMVACLDHPHIVPIYEVSELRAGEARSPVHYFTMKLMEGGRLDHLKLHGHGPARSREVSRQAACIVAAVARAVHHAPQRGILHRDLKPSNILLDAEGQPHVTDFGLAKRIETDSSLTHSGAILGTPSYVAPEQTQGKKEAVTTAADVYGLGAILYYLLTGRAPFVGENALDTLERVRHSEPVRPSCLNDAVPRDLETICLKCLQKVPEQRYPSAHHVAEDLNRFLEGKPVLARPTGLVERWWKWVRRHPTQATILGVSLTAAAVVAILAVIEERRVHGALQQAQTNALEAERQKEQASANYRQARETLRSMLERASDPKRGDIPRLQELRREQLEDALAFFLRIAGQQEQTPEVRFDVAEAHLEAGRIQGDLRRTAECKANFEQAVELSGALLVEFPQDPRYRALHARCTCELPRVHGWTEETLRRYHDAHAVWTELVQEYPASAEYRDGLASAESVLAGYFFSNEKDHAKAKRHFRRALAIYEELAGEAPARSKYQLLVAQRLVDLSIISQSSNWDEEALPALGTSAVGLFGSPGVQGYLATAAASFPGRAKDDAKRFHDRAEASLERLLQDEPNSVYGVLTLAALRINWGYMLRAWGKREAALADLDKNVQALERLRLLEPNLNAPSFVLMNTQGVRATLLEDLKRYRDAVAAFEQVVALTAPENQQGLRIQLALLRCEAGDYAKAVADVEVLSRQLNEKSSWIRFYMCAQIYSELLGNASDDKALIPSERAAQIEHNGSTALRLLERARAAAGAQLWKQTITEKKLMNDFEPLWKSDKFGERLKQQALPKD